MFPLNCFQCLLERMHGCEIFLFAVPIVETHSKREKWNATCVKNATTRRVGKLKPKSASKPIPILHSPLASSLRVFCLPISPQCSIRTLPCNRKINPSALADFQTFAGADLYQEHHAIRLPRCGRFIECKTLCLTGLVTLQNGRTEFLRLVLGENLSYCAV